jgi:hypothetical protein
MTTVTCTHEGCQKKFTKNNEAVAQAALSMHVGRVHTRNILNSPRENGSVVRRGPGRPRKHHHEHVHAHNGNGNGVIVKSRLSLEERQAILVFIRTHHSEYTTKMECFRAAMASSGATGKIQENSVAVCRYFQMALKRKAKPFKNDAPAPEEKPHRYRRDIVDKVLDRYSDQAGRLECPNCRYDFGPLKTSRVPARYCPGCGVSMQTFINQLVALLNP